MHEGIVSYELGVIGRPAVAEDLAVARDILLSGNDRWSHSYCSRK